jgi:hypothetical protein
MPRTIPVAREHVVVGRKRVDKGVVRVRKRTQERTQDIDVPLLHEKVDVERVRMHRVCDAPTPPRREGDVLVVPRCRPVTANVWSCVKNRRTWSASRRTSADRRASSFFQTSAETQRSSACPKPLSA